MRFTPTGPDIPDELLLALDQGRVVFFCGAGVSRARANLPDFFDLADKVLKDLGVGKSDPASKILAEAREMEVRTGVPGLISADRVFGLLERQFGSSDIDSAVARALTPVADVDLSAHKLLLDLATAQDGKTKLVTTNFDRLFDDCGDSFKSWQPPKLPDPTRPGELDGVVYLHGRVTEQYDGSEGDGFVLSSAEFGRAYLSEGWATQFFKDVIDRYAVVFIGYAADDPPVQYLLEALNKKSGLLNEVYAFQSGDDQDAKARWEHKGVTAIPYSDANDHEALWNTLEEWADRAKSPEDWQEKTIELACKGPEALSPFERERVTHLVSTKEGARKFLESDPPPPATWLCVFDRSIRYSKPDKILYGDDEGQVIDPFQFYGLANDIVPQAIHPDDILPKRETPSTAWDAFALNGRDRAELRDEHVTVLRGGASLSAGILPDRVNLLGLWLTKVAHQNGAVWWGARQHGLHPWIQQKIRWSLERGDLGCEPHILQSWHYLFEHWRSADEDNRLDWYRFADELKVIGWSNATVRKYEALSRPKMTASHNYFRSAVPPQADEKTKVLDLLRLELKYIENSPDIMVPDEWLAEVVAALKRNLDVGIQLETETGHYSFLDIPPIIPSDDPDISGHDRSEGLRGAVLNYAAKFERLIALDPKSARQEASSWSVADSNIFARLRIWAGGFEVIVPNSEFQSFTDEVSNEAFWNIRHQRDLLLQLKKRWATLPLTATRRIEERILEGRERWKNEAEHEFVPRRAWAIADRLHWLHTNDCRLNLNYEREIENLLKAAPDWSPKYGDKATDSRESKVGTVRTHTEFDELISVPLDSVLEKSQELLGRHGFGFDKRDPFAGLCCGRPVLAVAALRRKARIGEYPEWAWRRFLNSESRKEDKPRFRAFVAKMLLAANPQTLAGIMYPVSEWLLSASNELAQDCHPVFDEFLEHAFDTLSIHPDAGGSGMVRGSSAPDWATQALNSPAGKIAQALLNDPRRNGLERNEGLPPVWATHVQKAMALPDQDKCRSLVFFSYFLHWFYNVDPEWTEEHLLALLAEGTRDQKDAWWSGYLWGMRSIPSFELSQKLKPHLVEKVVERGHEDRDKRDGLVILVLASWVYSDEGSDVRFDDAELRDLLLQGGDEFRAQALWQMERRGKAEGQDGQTWRAKQESFLRDVWPVQLAARTAQNSARLVELAFSNDDRFIEISELILPLIGPIERDQIMLPSLRRGEENIINAHPLRVLDILYIALPDDANKWPHEIDATIKRIAEVKPELRTNPKWVELMRRWNSR
jgi:hypothetical protein